MAEGWINKMAEGLFTALMKNNANSYKTNSKKIIDDVFLANLDSIVPLLAGMDRVDGGD